MVKFFFGSPCLPVCPIVPRPVPYERFFSSFQILALFAAISSYFARSSSRRCRLPLCCVMESGGVTALYQFAAHARAEARAAEAARDDDDASSADLPCGLSVQQVLRQFKALPAAEERAWQAKAVAEQRRFLTECTAALEADPDAEVRYQCEAPPGITTDDTATAFPNAAMRRIINLAEDGSGARHSADALFITAKAAELFMTRRLWDARAVCVGAKRSKILPGDLLQAMREAPNRAPLQHLLDEFEPPRDDAPKPKPKPKPKRPAWEKRTAKEFEAVIEGCGKAAGGSQSRGRGRKGEQATADATAKRGRSRAQGGAAEEEELAAKAARPSSRNSARAAA